MKFVIYTDYKASYKPMTWDYKAIEAKTLEEAIETADKMWNPETCYLMNIMKKSSKVIVPYHAGYKYEEYTAILTKRSDNWHRTTKENGEQAHKVNKNWLTNDKNEVWYELSYRYESGSDE